MSGARARGSRRVPGFALGVGIAVAVGWASLPVGDPRWAAAAADAEASDAYAAAATEAAAASPDASSAAPPAGPASAGPAAEPVSPPPKDWRELAPGLRIGGSLRIRYEAREDPGFQGGDHDDYLLGRVRVNLAYTPVAWAKLFVEAQLADIQGESDFDPEALPSIFADRLDLHQGYVELAAPVGEVPLRLRAGRQKLAFGRERLVSPLEWVNTARVFDAIRLTVGEEQRRTVDAFASRLVGVDPDDANDWGPTRNRYYDSSFHGVYLQDRELIPESRIELYALLRVARPHDDEVWTFGGRLESRLGPVDVEVEGAWQVGRFGDRTHRAHMLHGEVGVTVPLFEKARLAAIANWGSGDPDPGDSVHQTFDNLYPLNHAYYGFIDFFALQNVYEVAAEVKVWVVKGLVARAAYHAFWLDEEEDDAWYHAGLGVKRAAPRRSVDAFVGTEVDLTLTALLFEDRVELQVGYCHFFAGAYVRDTGPSDDADFLYLQAALTW